MSRRSSITGTDLHRVLDVVDACAQAPLAGQHLSPDVLVAICRLVSADEANYEEIDPYRRRIELQGVDPSENDEPPEDALVTLWWQAFWESCAHPQRSGNFTDAWGSGDALPGPRKGRRWREFAEAIGIREASDLIISLAPQGPVDRRLLVWRADGGDFSSVDAQLMCLVRPHVQQMLQRQQNGRHPAAVLTARQLEILRIASTGCSNAEIAGLMVLSEGTVRKHLENIYRRLGVTNRGAAIAWLREGDAS